MSDSTPSTTRRGLLAAASALPALGLPTAARAKGKDACPPAEPAEPPKVSGSKHFFYKQVDGQQVRLHMLRKNIRDRTQAKRKGVIVFVHGSSMAGAPVFDLSVPGKPGYSVMDYFARLGYDTWCPDMEGYGLSDKSRNINFDIANGADDLLAISNYIAQATGQKKLMYYGISSGALRCAVFAQRNPDRVARLALDGMVWTGEGSPTLEQQRKLIPELQAHNRRPIDFAAVQNIFTRDNPGASDPAVVKAFAQQILALDVSVPTGAYLDMATKLPICDPEKITAPTLVMRGEFDGIATFQDVLNFFSKLPNADKQFAHMPGITHLSLQALNKDIPYAALDNFFGMPAPIYKG